MKARILLLPGDGVGPEVAAEGRRGLEAVARLYGHDLVLVEGLIGLMALDATGEALPGETVAACRVCDAALVGAVAGPPSGVARQALGELGRRCELHGRTVPMRSHPALGRLAPVRPELLTGVDLLLVSELAASDDATSPRDSADHRRQRVLRTALRAAARRRHRLTAVDPESRRGERQHWRALVEDVAAGYPDVALERVSLASCRERLLARPARLDVILSAEPHHHLLVDDLAALAGSRQLLPVALLGDGGFGIYGPVHGAASDLAGTARANPTGMLLAVALLLRHSLELDREARALEQAVRDTIAAGEHPADLASDPSRALATGAFTGAVLARLEAQAARAGGRA